MARIVVEDALNVFGGNVFELVNIVSKRARQLASGAKRAYDQKGKGNKPVVSALREISYGLVSSQNKN